MSKLFQNSIFACVISSFFIFNPVAFSFADENDEGEKPEEQSCAVEILKENEEKGIEMTEKEFNKAVKKCEKKKARKNKPKCQPTGSRLSRC